MLNAPVFQPVFSAPSPACLITNDVTFWFEPRSTCRNLVASFEHHLLPTPTAESKAMDGPSVPAQAVEPLAGLPAARLVPSSGAAAGGVKPSLNDGGTSAGLVPHEEAPLPIVYCKVAPPAMSAYRTQLCWVEPPLTAKDWTYWLPCPALVALIWMSPLGRSMKMDGNSGPCTASVSAPGVAGYMPSAPQTYQAEVAPRS